MSYINCSVACGFCGRCENGPRPERLAFTHHETCSECGLDLFQRRFTTPLAPGVFCGPKCRDTAAAKVRG